MYKLKENDILGNLLDATADILNSRKQRVAFTGRFSSRTTIEAGIPQKLILGPLSF